MKLSKYIPVIMFSTLLPNIVMANGETTYKQVCMACHTSGVAGAPKLGDKAKWAPLIKEGQAILTAHGYVGIRGMPAKGGKSDLSIEAFSAAVIYMANQAGADWKVLNQTEHQKITRKLEKSR